MGFVDGMKGRLGEDLAEKKARELQRSVARKTDKIRQHEYAVARESILGQFSSSPVSACYQCLTDPKAARRRDRLELVNRSILTSPQLSAVAARLRMYVDEVEYMRCSKHVYLAYDPHAPSYERDHPPPGFKKATPAQLEAMGLNSDVLAPQNSSFRAAVYMKDPAVWGPNPTPPAVLAFRGSTAAVEDWQNNFAQDANRESDYYRRAVNIGNALAKKGASVHIVGHSLGGGLASAAQGGSGLTASSYNAAGLHCETVARYSTDPRHLAAEPQKIRAIRLKGEALTKTQENAIGSRGLSTIATKSVGIKYDLNPSHDENFLKDLKRTGCSSPDEDYDTYLHGIDEVIDSTEKQKREDEATLQEARGRIEVLRNAKKHQKCL